jgi:glycosyltransferase involved in cell wall biosynthesis
VRVLYLSYNGLTEPLGRRQVLPYLVALAGRGWRFTVISFEKAETADPAACSEVDALLRPAGIKWVRRRYHRRPTVPATAFDLGVGAALRWACAGAVDLIHARSTVPALMAALGGLLRARPWIFDVRGLMAEEYADAGHWRRDGGLFRSADAVERRLLRVADGLVFLTERIRDELRDTDAIDGVTPVAVIPCGADLSEFAPSPDARRRVRSELGLGDAPVLVYSGTLGSWYRVAEMLRFFGRARAVIPGLRFLMLTPQADEARRAAREERLEADVLVRSLRPTQVPEFLAAADAGICFLGDHHSKAASSPTKYGEYLASGLPVVTNRYTGDASRLDGEKPWILLDAFADDDYVRAAAELKALLHDPEEMRRSARDLATREFSLEGAVARYDDLYRRVLENRVRRARE